MRQIAIAPLTDLPHVRQALSELLVETVASGGSVSFMHPLPVEAADTFWRDSLAAAARGDRVVLGAFDGETLVATVTLLLGLPPNQPHRAEIAKMLVRRNARRHGVGALVLAEAERAAFQAGRSLLVLDTASADAERLYERSGWQRVGAVPRYALMPDGPFCSTVIFYKDLAAH